MLPAVPAACVTNPGRCSRGVTNGRRVLFRSPSCRLMTVFSALVVLCQLLTLARGVPQPAAAASSLAVDTSSVGKRSSGAGDDGDDSSESSAEDGMEKPKPKKVLVVMLNGFRWDYVSRDEENLPNFQRLQAEGASAEYLESCFPSLQYPAWTTISTGRWPEDHGIIGNYMYDRSTEDVFDMLKTTTTKWRKWWQNAEPIWITAENKGHKAALYQWSRCDVDFKGKRPMTCFHYNASQSASSEDLRSHLNAALTKLEGTADLAMVYNEAVGNAGRRYGPDSAQTKQAVKNIDDVLGNFLFTLVNTSTVADSLNVLILSDHGMTTTDSKTKIIVDDFIVERDSIRKVVGREAYMNILPRPGAEKAVQRALSKVPNIRFYRKHAVPKYLNFGKAPLGLVFLVLADEGSYLQGISSSQQIPRGPDHGIPEMGLSGYDPIYPDMRGIFFGIGPEFSAGYAGGPLKLVDMHAMIKRLLGMEAKDDPSSTKTHGFVTDAGSKLDDDADDKDTSKSAEYMEEEDEEILERIGEYVKASGWSMNMADHDARWRRMASVFLPLLAFFLGRVSMVRV